MSEIKFDVNRMGLLNVAGKKKDWDPNPWAVCHTTVDKDKNPEKFERCVQHVKDEQTDGDGKKGKKSKKGKKKSESAGTVRTAGQPYDAAYCERCAWFEGGKRIRERTTPCAECVHSGIAMDVNPDAQPQDNFKSAELADELSSVGGGKEAGSMKQTIRLASSKATRNPDGSVRVAWSHEDWIRVGLESRWMTEKEASMSREGKWGKDTEVPESEKGKWTNYSLDELKSKLNAAKERQEKRDKADPKDTSLIRELQFAIRAKQKGKGHWGKVKD